MDETKLYSWFLGPKAENAEFLERLVLEAIRDCVFWRRNFHPEDDILITERVKRDGAFQDAQALMQQEFLSLLAHLKRDVPFFSPRHIGHMLGDQLLPAIAAYFAAMLHNPNNVSRESSPITTQYELEVAAQLARLMGWTGATWGHITSGGTIANFEALWIARNLRYFPLAVRGAARALEITELPVTLPTGETINLVATSDNWTLVNLDATEVLQLRERLQSACATHTSAARLEQQLAAHSLSGQGVQRFFTELPGAALTAGVVLAPATGHYSMQKVVEALGLGKEQLVLIPVDSRFRMDIVALRERLRRCREEQRPIIAVVSVLGSTEEGAVDQLDKIAALQSESRKHGQTFYHHCDGAWGGYVRALFFDRDDQPVKTPGAIRELTQAWPTDEIFASYSAVVTADSVTIDPHKLGYIPYPCGAIVFRHANVKDLITIEAPYVFQVATDPERPFIGRHILEGSKPGAAAAACWFAHRVVPLNHNGYGLLIGKSIQGLQDVCYRLTRELAPELARQGILLRLLTDPPDGNLFCFAVNRTGNQSLAVMNRLNQALYDELKFNAESVIQRHKFIISSTELTFHQYGLPNAQGQTSMDEHLAALGIPVSEFAAAGFVKVLRSTVMSPWVALSRGGNPDYSAAFADALLQVIKRVVLRGTQYV